MCLCADSDCVQYGRVMNVKSMQSVLLGSFLVIFFNGDNGKMMVGFPQAPTLTPNDPYSD